MNHIISLEPSVMLDVIDLYTKYRNDVDIYRGFEHYFVKYQFNEGMGMVEIKLHPQYYDITLSEEASVLQMTRNIPTLNIHISVEKGNVKYWKLPKDPVARAWLNKRYSSPQFPNTQTTRAEHLLAIGTTCTMIWSMFMPLLQKKVIGDTTYYAFEKGFKKTAEEYMKHMLFEKRKANLLEGWDTVNLTENQYYKICDTNKEHGFVYDKEHFALSRFCLCIFDGKQNAYYFYEKKGKTLRCGITDTASYVTKFFDVEIGDTTPDGIDAVMLPSSPDVEEWCNEVADEATDGTRNWEWVANAFFLINTFMLNVGDVTMEVETKEAVAPTDGTQSKRKSERNAVRLFKSYRLIKGWKNKARKKAEITCPCWGVRGHFRHYRNGKVVFVEAYVKGKEKEAYKGKEYDLLPYKDA